MAYRAPYTDLACERLPADTELLGIKYCEEEKDGFTISRLTIESDEGAASIGKPRGHYLSLSFPPLSRIAGDELPAMARCLSGLLRELCRYLETPPRSVLVVGLGNRAMTPDALGPRCLSHVVATHHLREEAPLAFETFAKVALSLFAPGVMGETGMEPLSLVKGAVAAAEADLVLAVDALAARAAERLGSTVQLSDTGICPGAGVGNAKAALNAESLGVPVFSIGIPTVVGSRTLLADVLDTAGVAEDSLPPPLRALLAEKETLFVCPEACDAICERGARLIGAAIHYTFSRGTPP